MSSSSDNKVNKSTKPSKKILEQVSASASASASASTPTSANKQPKKPTVSTSSTKEPKSRKTYKKTNLQPIIEDETLNTSYSTNNIETDTSLLASVGPVSRTLSRSFSESSFSESSFSELPVNNSHDNMDMDNMEKILQEIHDSEIAEAMDASFASNIAVQMDSNNLIDEDMELILEQIRERENIQSLEEEEAKELIAQNELKHNQEMADEAFARSLEEEDNYYNNTSTSNASSIISNVSNVSNVSNQKDIFNEQRSIREQQDIEYSRVLQEDIERETRKQKHKYNNDNKNVISSSLLEEHDVSDKNQESEESDCDDKPKTLEELRKIRLAFYAKK